MISTRRMIRSLSALVLAVGIAACGEEGPTNGNGGGGTVASVTVSPPSATLTTIGGTVQLSAAALDASGDGISGKTFTWDSADDAIATVSSSGLVTAVANGMVNVTATTDGRTGTSAITVNDGPITSVTVADNSFSPTPLNVASGATVTWNWTGSNPHNVTFNDGMMNSSTQTSGSHNRQFTASGTYGYFCTIHGASIMSGEVIVP